MVWQLSGIMMVGSTEVPAVQEARVRVIVFAESAMRPQTYGSNSTVPPHQTQLFVSRSWAYLRGGLRRLGVAFCVEAHDSPVCRLFSCVDQDGENDDLNATLP